MLRKSMLNNNVYISNVERWYLWTKIMHLDVMKMSDFNEVFNHVLSLSMLILLQMGNILQTGISLQSLRSFPITSY